MLTIVHGWRPDAERWLLSVFTHSGAHDFEAVVVDNSGDERIHSWVQGRRAERFRSLLLDPPLGWAAAANAGIRAAAGEYVVLFDPGIELTGDVIGPLLGTLAQPAVVLAGAFGVRGEHSVKHFSAHPGPEVDAVEGYCMAFRREQVLEAGGFDEKFRFYRIADFELSYRLRSRGGRALLAAGLPLVKHAHRLWEAQQPEERERLSKKNFYRFLDLWGDRSDLLLG